nr:hypothetical protein CTI12_AA136010 [Tanacetum cinerariifolium]
GEASIVPVESHHTPSGAPTTSQPPLSSPLRIPTRQETKVPQLSSLTHTHVADEAASTNRVLALKTDLQQTKKVYSTAFTKLIMKVKNLEKIVKSKKARRRAKIVVSDDEDAAEDSSKQWRKKDEIDQDHNISLVQHDDERKNLKRKGIKIPSKLFFLKYLSPASIIELNKNPSAPKRVHFVNSIVILNKESEAEEVETTTYITLEYGHNITKEANEQVKEVIDEEESKVETDEEVEEILEDEEEDEDDEYFNSLGSRQKPSNLNKIINFVRRVCLYMHDPSDPHFTALKRILCYVCGTLDYGLQLYVSSTTQLSAYTDADWAGCPVTRSVKAEYRGVANVVAETAWICNLLFQHQRTKHIEIDIYFVHDFVASGQVLVLYVPSKFQYADIFTKGLPIALFIEFRSNLNVQRYPVYTEEEY